ncbi:hypothetical protein AN958_07536, partial [Leucoagaricus sp. SymC.cos]
HLSDILHIHEPSANQSFIVNKSLLTRKLKFLLDRDTPFSYPTFVHLPDRGVPLRVCGIPRFLPPNAVLTFLPKLAEIPSSIYEVLQIMGRLTQPKESSSPGESPTSIKLPRNLPSTVCIPLAAILLDYPVAYVPSSENQTTFLSGVPLVLYRCCIIFPAQRPEGGVNRGKEHTLFQFSNPALLADDSAGAMSVERTLDHLKPTFEPRILHSFPGSTFRVDHERIALDRVAL